MWRTKRNKMENENLELEQEPITPVLEPAEKIEVQESTEIENAAEVKEEPQKPWKKKHVPADQRINKITFEKHEAIRRAEAAEKKLAEIERVKEPDDESTDEQRKAYSNQQTEDIRREAVADYKIEEEAAANERSHKSVVNKYANKREKAVTRYKDYGKSEESIMDAMKYYNNPALENLIMGSEDPTALVDYFGTNDNELEKIAQLSSNGAARLIGKIESKLVRAPIKTNTAPPPTTTSGESGGGVVKKDINKMSQKEYNAHMNNKQYG